MDHRSIFVSAVKEGDVGIIRLNNAARAQWISRPINQPHSPSQASES
jgi:hypothetical protein